MKVFNNIDVNPTDMNPILMRILVILIMKD